MLFKKTWDHFFTLSGTLNAKEFWTRFFINLVLVIFISLSISLSVIFVVPYIEHIQILDLSPALIFYGPIFLLIASLYTMNQLSLFVRYARYLGFLKST